MTTSDADATSPDPKYYTREELAAAFGEASWRGSDNTEPTGTLIAPSKHGPRILLALVAVLAISLPVLAHLDGGIVSVVVLSVAALWIIVRAVQNAPEAVWFVVCVTSVAVIAPFALFRDGTWGDKLAYGAIGIGILLAASVVTFIRAVVIALREPYWHALKVLSEYDVSLTSTEVYGAPGDLRSGIGKFSGVNIAKGAEGERRTAELLEELLIIPGTRIVHGLRWPGSDYADIDHVVVNGSRVAVVDSKMWSGGTFATNGQGGLFRLRGEDVALDMNVHTADAVRDLSSYLGEDIATVAGWLAIHSYDGQPVECNVQITPDLGAVPAFDAIHEIGEWFSEGSDGTINPVVMLRLFQLLK